MPLTHANAFSKLDEIADTALIQLVYVSSLTLASRLNAAIFDEVEAHARDYNEQHGITGTLCYGNGHFLQCIEGEKAEVAALTQRDFSDWRMRLLFLERWLWSPATKKQAAQLSPYLPLAPHGGSAERTEQFLQIIKTFDTPPHIKAAGITYNALGNMVRHIAAPHQAFLVVQGFLSVLLIVGLVLLYL